MPRLSACVTTMLPMLVAALLCSATQAAESPLFHSSRTTATLITDTDAVAAGTPFYAALRLHLAPGWHTYWQNPGDAGIPPALDFSVPPDTHASPIEWPVPQRVAEGTLTTYAYTGDVVLPFLVTPGPGPLSLKAHAEWLACKDICVPEQADLAVLLPQGAAVPAPEASLIRTALAHIPAPSPFSSSITPDRTLTITGAGVPTDIASAEFFPSEPGIVQRSAINPTGTGESRTFQLDPASPPTGSAVAAGVLALTSRAGVTRAYTLTPEQIAAPLRTTHLAPLLLLAIAGGLLLNLMPCVFPILAMKAVSLTRMSGAETRRVRAEAVSYCLGVVASFVALGAVLASLRQAGQGAGWGFQFQSPTFVIAVSWILLAVGLSLSGVFSVGRSFMGAGNTLAARGGHLGSFLTGVLAVVVASPCTAPFMGTALAGTLTLPAQASLAVFAALGVGLALPYAALALIPRFSTILPRPGLWMVTLQQLLAFPMYAAAVWLVWVASQQGGPAGVLTAGLGMVVVGLGAWSLGFAGQRSGWSSIAGRSSAAISGLVLLGLLYTDTTAPAEQTEPYTQARFEALRSEGRPIFVNMTAAWCLSCLVNERVALSPAAVRDAFAQSNVAYLKGDWTSQNPAISAYLHQLGRDGVPLYVLYPPGRDPIVLPEILSETTVLDELAKLKS